MLLPYLRARLPNNIMIQHIFLINLDAYFYVIRKAHYTCIDHNSVIFKVVAVEKVWLIKVRLEKPAFVLYLP